MSHDTLDVVIRFASPTRDAFIFVSCLGALIIGLGLLFRARD